MVKCEADKLRQVIVCAPEKEYFQIDNLEAHNIEAVANPEEAKAQHQSLRELAAEAGAEVINLPELAEHPNSVFTRDTALVTPDGLIHLRMGLPSRRGEEDWMAQNLLNLGLEKIARIQAPGTVEGGDIILAGKVAFVGFSPRSNQAGVSQIKPILERAGYQVRIVPTPSPHLHLGGMMSLLTPEDVICTSDWNFQEYLSGFKTHVLPAKEPTSANVISFGEGELVVEASSQETADLLDQAGFKIHLLNLSEFVKGSGGPTCLILPTARG